VTEQRHFMETLFSRWLGKPNSGPEFEPTLIERSTAPDAPMTLFVRVQTRNGPHTIVASGITLTAASQISEAMELAGHHAEFVDQCAAAGTIPQRVGRKELERRLNAPRFDRMAFPAARA
jgi:hypothetical protein